MLWDARKTVCRYKAEGTGPEIQKSVERHFEGFSSIKNEEELMDLAGVSRDNFELLLKRTPDSYCNSGISKEDRLLIFLVKLKTGLTYSAIGVLFGVHRTTISRVFINLLTALVQATSDFVTWPSIDVVQNTMPKCFKDEYPRTRVVIDCTEFRIDVPSRVDQEDKSV